MARKASDLLDVFRLSDERDEAEARSKTRATTKRKPSRPARKPAPRKTESVILSRKHMLYAGSVVVLLLALAFVLGIAAGSDDVTPTSALRRDQPVETWYVRGRLPKLDWTDSQPIDIRAIARQLTERHSVKKGLLSVRQTAEHYFIYLGPFASKDEAYSYLEIRAIDRFGAGGQFPFANPKVLQGKPVKSPSASSD